MAKSPEVTRFMGATASGSPEGFELAVFGAPHGTPYPGIDNRVHESAPDAFRMALEEDSGWLDSWDFDFSGLIMGQGLKCCDLGNLETMPQDGAGNRRKIEEATRRILEAGAVPIMFGGDDSVPIPFLAAYAGRPVTILQIDAHIDWREERYGERLGFSSTMRRAAEYDHVESIVQAGARGIGSAREGEVRDARAWGARLITSRAIHHDGIAQVLEHIPDGGGCVICLDCDALDISEMPAVVYPSPGGLTYTQVTDMIAAVAAKARIAGFSMVEFVAGRDPTGTSAFTAARIACNVMGQIARNRLRPIPPLP